MFVCDIKLLMIVVIVIILVLNVLKVVVLLVNNVCFLIFEYKIIKDLDKEILFIFVNIVVYSVNLLIYFCKYIIVKWIWMVCFFCLK